MIVARRAEDVVSLASTLQDIRGDIERKRRRKLAIHAAGIEMLVFVQHASGDNADGQRPRRTMIRKEIAFLERFVAGLIRHLLPARGKQEQPRKQRK